MVGTQGRGRAKKSIEQHKLAGTYRKDRHEPTKLATPKGQPVKPSWVTGMAAEYWDLITPQLIELEIATELDSEALACHCVWYAEFREALKCETVYNEAMQKCADAMNHLAQVAEKRNETNLFHVAEAACDLIVTEITKRMPKPAEILSRKKTAFEMYSKSCARFGLTPMDRRAMPDIEANGAQDDPLTNYLKSRQELGEG